MYSIIVAVVLFIMITITAVDITIFGIKKYFSQPGFNDDGFHFDNGGYFSGYKDVNLFKNLKDCHTYETPIYIFAPMGIKRDIYKTKIVDINNNSCKIQNLMKYPTDSDWRIISENYIPLDKAKRLSLKIIQEFNNPDEGCNFLSQKITIWGVEGKYKDYSIL